MQQVSLAGECRIGLSTVGIVLSSAVVLEIVIMADEVSKLHAYVIVLHGSLTQFQPSLS